MWRISIDPAVCCACCGISTVVEKLGGLLGNENAHYETLKHAVSRHGHVLLVRLDRNPDGLTGLKGRDVIFVSIKVTTVIAVGNENFGRGFSS